MALKGKWKDKVDGVDDIVSEDINSVARAVIETEEELEETGRTLDKVGENLQETNKRIDEVNKKIDDIPLCEENIISSKNLLDVTWKNAWLTVDGGELVETTSKIASFSEYIKVEAMKPYTFSGKPSYVASSAWISMYDENKKFIGRFGINFPNVRPFTTTFNNPKCAYVRFYISPWGSPPNTWQDVIPKDFQLEEGEVATSYVAPRTEKVDVSDLLEFTTSIEKLSLDMYKAWYLDRDDGVTFLKDVPVNLTTIAHIQLHKGDKITTSQQPFDVFRYTDNKEYIGYNTYYGDCIIEEDCLVRIAVDRHIDVDGIPELMPIEDAANMITIYHNSRLQIKFDLLPLESLRKFIEGIV